LQNFLGSRPDVTLVGPLATSLDLDPSTKVIYVDGGLNVQGGPAGLSIGDGDSSTQPLDILLPREKDVSDLAFVLHCLPDTIRSVAAHGFLGGRRDHEWINLGEFYSFMCRHSDCHIALENSGRFVPAGESSVPLFGIFSILAFQETNISITGACKYQQTQPTVFSALSSLGLSNDGFGEVRITCDRPVLIWQNAR
jgi:thiamine pyrophosphokinase